MYNASVLFVIFVIFSYYDYIFSCKPQQVHCLFNHFRVSKFCLAFSIAEKIDLHKASYYSLRADDKQTINKKMSASELPLILQVAYMYFMPKYKCIIVSRISSVTILLGFTSLLLKTIIQLPVHRDHRVNICIIKKKLKNKPVQYRSDQNSQIIAYYFYVSYKNIAVLLITVVLIRLNKNS